MLAVSVFALRLLLSELVPALVSALELAGQALRPVLTLRVGGREQQRSVSVL